MGNESFNQRLTPEERVEIIQAVGWKKVTEDLANSEGWISRLVSDQFDGECSVNIQTGTFTDHSGDFSFDIVDMAMFVVDGLANREQAIHWIQEKLGKNSNGIELQPDQMRFKTAIERKHINYGMYPIELLKNPDITPTGKLIWMAIQERCGKGKSCSWAGYNKIMKDTGIASRETVRKGVKELVEKGYLIEKSRGRGKAPKRYPICFIQKSENSF